MLPSRTMERDASLRAARLTALVFPALVAPAVVLLAATALIRGDYDLLIAGLVVLVGAAVAGGMAGIVVFELRLGRRGGSWAVVSWTLTLAAPTVLIWALTARTAPVWLRSSALLDALPASDIWPFALAFAGVSSAVLLGAGIVGDKEQPSILRYRDSAFTDRAFFAAAALFFVVAAALATTRPARFATSDRAELVTELPRLRREAARYPSHFRSQYLYGNALTHVNDCAHAVDPLRRAVAIRPHDGWAQNDFAYALSCSQRFAEARAPYEEAARLLPDEPMAHDGLAYVLEKLRDVRAESTYHANVARWPDDAYATAREAALRFDRGERDEGLDEMRHALTLGDTSYSVRLSAAELFARADSIDAIASVDSGGAMRDPARRGVPSKLPLIPPRRRTSAESSSPR